MAQPAILPQSDPRRDNISLRRRAQCNTRGRIVMRPGRRLHKTERRELFPPFHLKAPGPLGSQRSRRLLIALAIVPILLALILQQVLLDLFEVIAEPHDLKTVVLAGEPEL